MNEKPRQFAAEIFRALSMPADPGRVSAIERTAQVKTSGKVLDISTPQQELPPELKSLSTPQRHYHDSVGQF